MTEPKYQIGDRIPGTIGKVISKTYSHDNRWIYCIQFDGGFLTISEENIDSSIIEVLQPTNNDFPSVMSIALDTGDRNILNGCRGMCPKHHTSIYPTI